MRIEFEALHNVRDLGGMIGVDGRTIRSGLLFRGDQPFFSTERDKDAIAALGIRKSIDFRSRMEHEDKPDPVIPLVKNVYLPIIEDVRMGITHGHAENTHLGQLLMGGADIDAAFVDAYMQEMYRKFVNDPFANGQYARFVDEVIESALANEGVFWHCTAGKDRAGFATVIVLEALGVSRETIAADYLSTNDYLSDFRARMMDHFADRFASDGARDAFAHFFSADASYLEAAYDEAASLYGSFQAYLAKAIDVDESKTAKLRSLLLA